MKHFRQNCLEHLEQTQHGFSRTSWQINVIDCLNPVATNTAGLEPSAVQHA